MCAVASKLVLIFIVLSLNQPWWHVGLLTACTDNENVNSTFLGPGSAFKIMVLHINKTTR